MGLCCIRDPSATEELNPIGLLLFPRSGLCRVRLGFLRREWLGQSAAGPGGDRLCCDLEVPELRAQGGQLHRRVLQCRADEQPTAGGHGDEDGALCSLGTIRQILSRGR